MTALLRTGDNAIGAMLGDGWYRGYLAWRDRRNVFGERLGLLCQLRIEYADGRVETVGTDEKWRASTGPILASDLYMGETYDARLEKPGWSAPGFADADWTPVRVVAEAPKHELVAPAGPPVRAIEEIKPVKILRTPGGRDGLRHGPEHGRLRPAEGERPGRDEGRPPPRRGARQGRQLLHRQPARGEAGGRRTC